MRNMSFSMTTEQIRNRTKTVTRRFGWWFLKPGDRVMAVEKCMGLEKGEKVKRICPIEIISAEPEALMKITKADCIKEGFPKMAPTQFMRMFIQHNGGFTWSYINRIEFKYLD